jgi:hypothetical protein
MIEYLRRFGIREVSKSPKRVLRALSWLFVPIIAGVGGLLAKSANGFLAIYGALLFVLGALIVFGSLIEFAWHVLSALGDRALRR